MSRRAMLVLSVLGFVTVFLLGWVLLYPSPDPKNIKVRPLESRLSHYRPGYSGWDYGRRRPPRKDRPRQDEQGTAEPVWLPYIPAGSLIVPTGLLFVFELDREGSPLHPNKPMDDRL